MTWLDAQHRRELDKVTMSPDELQALARKICEDWWYDTPKGGEALIEEVWDAFKEVQAATRQKCMAAQCEKCAEGVPVKKLSEGWYHIAGNACKAQPIRELDP